MKAFFFHIPKTGGVSIVSSIDKECDLESPGHISFDYALKKYGSDFMNSCFKFAFVRNPFDRFVSAYHYLIQQDENHKYWKYDKKISNEIKNINDFCSFCNVFEDKKDINRYHHFKTINSLICKDDKIMVDFIGRYETFNQSFLELTKKLHIQNVVLEKKNSSLHDPWQKYYANNEKGVNLVRNFYKKDFDIFNYSRDITNDK